MWIVPAAFAMFFPAYVSLHFFRMAVVRTRKASFSELMPDSEAFREHLKIMALDRDWLLAQPLENMSITSFDGLTLRARLWTEPGDKRLVLLSHGYRSMGISDFPSVTRFYRSLGCGVLLIDQRACGESEGRYIGFGALERRDIAAWADYLYRRFPELPIFLDGVSMGSTAVLLSLALPLPPTVRGAIADCGFTSPLEIMAHVQKTAYPRSGRWILGGLRLMLKAFARYDPSLSTVDALKKATVPVLFMHGDADKFVPVEMTLANYEACASEKRLIIVPGAGHGESYVLDREGCEQAIREFFDTYG